MGQMGEGGLEKARRRLRRRRRRRRCHRSGRRCRGHRRRRVFILLRVKATEKQNTAEEASRISNLRRVSQDWFDSRPPAGMDEELDDLFA